MGLSSSQIHQLEIASERIVYPMEPSEIVVHIGHNDMHHGNLTVDEFVARLTSLFEEYHRRLPNAKIYYCGVEAKKSAADEGSNRYESSFVKAPAVNSAVKALAQQNDWLVYVDTPTIFYSADGTINKNMYPSTDGSHPSLVAYDLMRLAIDKARGETLDNVITINQLGKNDNLNASGKTFTDKNGNALLGDFAISGKLAVTQFNKSNAHLHFRFSGGDRFILWDKSNDGKFGAGYAENNKYTDDYASGMSLYDANDGLVLNWTVIVKDGTAYWYINGQLKKTFASPAREYFNIGALQMNAVLYDIELDVKADDGAGYNAHIEPYFKSDTVKIDAYGYRGSLDLTGKTFTDAKGSALTNNYIIRGKLDVTAIGKDNPYIQFRFGGRDRFLLWDSNNDGKLGAGYTEGGSHVSDTASGITLYDASNGITLDWAIVVKNGVAYGYINGELEKRLSAPTLESFRINAIDMNVIIYNIELIVKSDDDAAYTAELLKCAGETLTIEKYGENGDIVASGKTFTDSKGRALTNNYIAVGTLDITKINKANAHLQFRVGSGCRFLLWDKDSDGVFGAGYMYNDHGSESDETPGVTLYDANNGLSVEWAVVVHEGVAYWYINGELEQEITSPKLESFNIGALQMNAFISNIEIFTKEEGAAVYYNELGKYFDNVLNINRHGQDGDIIASGKTFTDSKGNALTSNYAVTGKLDITSVNKSNAHLQFRVGSGCRFLLWDSDSNGVFGAGYMYNGSASDKTSGVTLYDANNGLTLEWAVVVHEGVAYWYINGKLEQKITSPKLDSFNIGALQMNVSLYDIELYVESENSNAYSSAISKYLES